jgi:hypothetical protein
MAVPIELTQDQLQAIKQARGQLNNRFALTRLHQDGGLRNGTIRLRLGLWHRPKISSENATVYVLPPQHVGKLGEVSRLHYGDSNYWWAIADVNNIKNQLTETEAGMVLLIPALDQIQSALTNGSESDF